MERIHASTTITVCCLFLTLWTLVAGNTCKCVPDQWEGKLNSQEREFDLLGGRSGSMENNIYVHYDYVNKKFAMTDMTTESRAIADYRKGYKYVIRGPDCHGIRTEESMRRMCLPDDAEFLGEFTIGEDIPVDIWQFSGPQNMSMRTTVVHKHCVPLSEEVYMKRDNYASLTSSLYLDVTLGLTDKSVFEPPIDCIITTMEENHMTRKRSHEENGWQRARSLRSMLYDIMQK